jgi:hypothetical protein
VNEMRRYLPLVGYFLLLFAVVTTVSSAPAQLTAPATALLEARVIRLFCSPCFDRSAQEMRVDDLRWVRAAGADQVEPEGGWTAPGAADRADASGSAGTDVDATVDPGVDDAIPIPHWFVVADGTTFDPAIVYVRAEGEWTNLALLAGLPAPGALPVLPAYIPVSPPPRHR